MKKLISNKIESGIQFIKFSLIGILNTGIHYAVFIFFIFFTELHFLFASALGYFAGLTNSFILNRKWTFAPSGGRKDLEIVKFILVNFAALMINLVSLNFLVRNIQIPPQGAQIIAIALSLTINFLGNKFWTFRPSR